MIAAALPLATALTAAATLTLALATALTAAATLTLALAAALATTTLAAALARGALLALALALAPVLATIALALATSLAAVFTVLAPTSASRVPVPPRRVFVLPTSDAWLLDPCLIQHLGRHCAQGPGHVRQRSYCTLTSSGPRLLPTPRKQDGEALGLLDQDGSDEGPNTPGLGGGTNLYALYKLSCSRKVGLQTPSHRCDQIAV